MDIGSYLQRIAYHGPTAPDRRTLEALIRAQLAAVPFENLDQQLGRTVSMAPEAVFDKIVRRQRGGWCFELNGLFCWALRQIGFEVMMIAGHVREDRPPQGADSDHMALRVRCDGDLLVDVGFGGEMNGAVALSPGTAQLPPYRITLTNHADGLWRYAEKAEGNDGGYWFRPAPVTAAVFAPENQRLQSDPTSSFRRNLVVQRRFEDRHVILRGRVKRTIDGAGCRTEQLENAAALVTCLRDDFNLDLPEAASLWPSLMARHSALFGSEG
jgi:N-hydroxyarylamine O-acetyltransferase